MSSSFSESGLFGGLGRLSTAGTSLINSQVSVSSSTLCCPFVKSVASIGASIIIIELRRDDGWRLSIETADPRRFEIGVGVLAASSVFVTSSSNTEERLRVVLNERDILMIW